MITARRGACRKGLRGADNARRELFDRSPPPHPPSRSRPSSRPTARSRPSAASSFTVARGEVFGFLGPNGAGKSTTINMLCTLARPTSGTARVSGFDVVAERDDVRRHIGLVFQDPTLDGYLTAEQNLRLHAELYGIDAGVVPARMRQMLEMVDLWDRRDQQVHDLLRRHAAAPGDRARPHALAARAVPRRADHRPRPPDPQLDLALHPRAAGDARARRSS